MMRLLRAHRDGRACPRRPEVNLLSHLAGTGLDAEVKDTGGFDRHDERRAAHLQTIAMGFLERTAYAPAVSGSILRRSAALNASGFGSPAPYSPTARTLARRSIPQRGCSTSTRATR